MHLCLTINDGEDGDRVDGIPTRDPINNKIHSVCTLCILLPLINDDCNRDNFLGCSHIMSAADIIYEQPSYDDGGAGDSNVGDDNGEGGLPLDGCGPLDGT